jgi:hypothetical protein
MAYMKLTSRGKRIRIEKVPFPREVSDMPIPLEIADKILKRINLRYASETIEPSISSDYDWIEVYSGQLPVRTKSEFEIAKEIGKRFNLKLKWMSFNKGEGLGEEGLKVNYELVFVMKCTTLEELKEASKKIAKAYSLLQRKLRKNKE